MFLSRCGQSRDLYQYQAGFASPSYWILILFFLHPHAVVCQTSHFLLIGRYSKGTEFLCTFVTVLNSELLIQAFHPSHMNITSHITIALAISISVLKCSSICLYCRKQIWPFMWLISNALGFLPELPWVEMRRRRCGFENEQALLSFNCCPQSFT